MFRLTRPRRLSRRSRSVSAVIAIAAVFWMVWEFTLRSTLGPPEPVVALPTERLSFAKLAADEEIVVTRTNYRQTPVELRFRRDGDATKVIVSDVTWSTTDRAWKMVRVRDVRPLTSREAAGLDAVLAHLRGRGLPPMSHYATDALEYRRAEIEVGREQLFESLLVSEWSAAQLFPASDPDARRELLKQAAREGVSQAELEQWVTFELLVPREDSPD